MLKQTQAGGAGEKTAGGDYSLKMDGRKHMMLTGVCDVVSFDEMTVILITEGGEVSISGQNLHVARLMLEEGQLVIDGNIDSFFYRDAKPKKKAARLLSRALK
jgi:YabP family.